MTAEEKQAIAELLQQTESLYKNIKQQENAYWQKLDEDAEAPSGKTFSSLANVYFHLQAAAAYATSCRCHLLDIVALHNSVTPPFKKNESR